MPEPLEQLRAAMDAFDEADSRITRFPARSMADVAAKLAAVAHHKWWTAGDDGLHALREGEVLVNEEHVFGLVEELLLSACCDTARLAAAAPGSAQFEANSEQNAAVAGREVWDAAFADYTAKKAASDADPSDESLTWLWVQAIDQMLISAPAPDLDALVLKLEWARERETECETDALSPLIWNALVSDARKLATA